MGVDIFPGPLVRERYFIRKDTNNRAVFGMELAQSVIDVTIRTLQILEDMKGRTELRTRRPASWVNISVIKGDSQPVYSGLGKETVSETPGLRK